MNLTILLAILKKNSKVPPWVPKGGNKVPRVGYSTVSCYILEFLFRKDFGIKRG